MKAGDQTAELIAMMEQFVSGTNRSRDFVRQIEGVFAACGLDEDERYAELQYSLALFGAGDRIHEERALSAACTVAMKILRAISG